MSSNGKSDSPEEWRPIRQPLTYEYGTWLATFPWDHFVTLTFRHSRQADAAVVAGKAWIRRLEQQAQKPLYWFATVESVADGGVHLHLLTKGTATLSVSAMKSAWSSGFADVERYDSGKGGAWYVAKALGSESAQWDCRLPEAQHPCASDSNGT